ncbi:pyridoxamine 5'-phosphate oxidase [Deinococcus aquiradiocola]|uniref:Pyridoxine/pyridoxamine 5'-phosphate oxidase n=1 Tax=Deinococcus aquiradiocola TaxID=393059 RepID=A0A917UQ47_9DEIO|nr:pyridoxamine 5'-phosphate oxidase [Deinococcus aquiradiocola]GGJ74462.1 pyridoxine/pyridoxamine 5'-phosphate oxidase [Deinococcus aquiradiocola]
MTDLTDLRLSYERDELRRATLNPDPHAQFSRWLEEALGSDLPEPYAVTLATADETGRPSARTVLLRGHDARGLVVYSNYLSHKGRDLHVNPQAELLFYWPTLERQVRAWGRVERLPEEESTAYFHKRPRDSQLAAHASDPQSAPIAGRAELDAKFAALHDRFPEGQPVPKPDFWGGYLLVPGGWEFWQGRPNRMHDRFEYLPAADGWRITRLMP